MPSQTKEKFKPAPEPVDNIHAIAQENLRRQEEQGTENGDRPTRALEPLLKLSTVLEPRAAVEIDAVNYELRHRREFSITEQHELQVEGDEFDTLWDKKEHLNNRSRQRMKTVLDSMFNKVLIAPNEVKDKLDDESRRAVVLTFTRAPLLLAEMERLKDAEYETDSLETSDT